MKNSNKIATIGKIIKNNLWWLGLLLFLYVFIYSPINQHNKKKHLKKGACMTIAYTIGEKAGRVTEIKYIYYVNGIEYQGASVSGFNWITKNERNGGKYLIKYACDNPQDALIYFDKKIEGDTIPAEYLK